MAVSLFAVSCLTILLLWITWIHGYPQFQEEIPNGHNVTNPCDGSIWQGVGHKNPGGGGDRNQFGMDFANNSYKWTPQLCWKDSDGDGRTNGEELGDPNCTWTKGATPERTTNITHPGICEPMDDAVCHMKMDWNPCGYVPFYCPAFNESGTLTKDLVFPNSSVPAQETTYVCLGYALPSDKKYHIVGMKPKVDNKKFLHHMLLFGCSQPLTAEQMSTPEECQMAVAGCLTLMEAWTVGIEGFCVPDNAGVAMGAGSIQYAVLQLHWNNPQLYEGEYDSSGMTLYYTPNLRPKEGIIISVGPLYLDIPPNQQNVVVEGGCAKECTESLGDTTLQIVVGALHMHLLGRSGKAVLTHADGTTETMIDETLYNYNNPKVVPFMRPFNLSAGDSINVTCRFDSTSKKNTTYWGEATSAEMCFVFIMIIPAVPGFYRCAQYKQANICDLSDNVTYGSNCAVDQFKRILGGIAMTCNPSCTQPCLQYVQMAKNTGCLDGDIGGFIRDFWYQQDPRVAQILQIADYCTAKAGITMAPATTMANGPSGASTQAGSGGSTMSNGPGGPSTQAGSGGSSMQGGPSGPSTQSGPGGPSTQGGSGGPGTSGESVGPGTESGQGGGNKDRNKKIIISSVVAGGVLIGIVLLTCCCLGEALYAQPRRVSRNRYYPYMDGWNEKKTQYTQ